MADLATLAIKVENGDVVKATSSLNSMAVAGGKTEAATQRLTRRMALLEIEARQMDAAMVTTTTTTARLAASLGLTETATAKLGHAFAAFSALAVAGFIGRKVIEETEAAQAAMAQLEAAVTSTGGAAGRSVAQLDALSISLQKQTTFSDEAVKGAEAMLLTFDKIKGANFDRATAAVTDLATRMGTDLHGAAVQVGKALQDPATGLTALRRSGVSFSESQIAVIKSLYDTGRVAEGQLVILKELEHQFGGSAAAARDTLGGALAGLKNAWGDLFEVTRGASTGTVTAINAITHALETSGLSMNTVLKDATVDWETMRASIEKVRAILALNIDSKFLQNARNIIERIDFDLSTKIAELNAPAKTGPVGGGGGTDTDTMDAKVRDELARRDQEIAKQRALNAAFGASATTIALLNNAYDAQAERAKNAIDHTTAETAALNARTNAMQAAKDAAVLLAAAEANRKQVADVQRSDADAVRDAKQARELAGLSDAAAAQRRVDMQAENDLAAARLRFAMMTRDLDKERADVAAGILQREQDIYNSTARRVEVVRQIGHETATVTAEMDKQKKAEEEAQREMERRAKELHRTISSTIEGIFTDIDNHRNPFVALFDNLKRGAIKAISDILASKIEGKVADFLGIKLPASKQEQAAKDMNIAADKQLRAAELMNGGTSGTSSGKLVDPATQGPAYQRYLQQFAKVGGSAYGGYQTGYGIGAATGDKGAGAIGGAVSGFMLGNALLPGLGGIVGGAAGFVGGLLGASHAAAQAAAEMEAARKRFKNAMDAIVADLNNDELAGQIAAAAGRFDDLRQAFAAQVQFNGSFKDFVNEFVAGLKNIKDIEAQYIAKLKEEAALKLSRGAEDFDVRAIRAEAETAKNEGRTADAARLTKEADDRAFENRRRREREDLRKSFGETIGDLPGEAEEWAAFLRADAAEVKAHYSALATATGALNDFATAVRNAPTGFKLEPYIQQYASGAPYPGTYPINPLPVPVNPFVPPTSPLSPTLPALSRTGTVATAPVQMTFGANAIQININGSDLSKKEIAAAVASELDGVKERAFGGNKSITRAQALERVSPS